MFWGKLFEGDWLVNISKLLQTKFHLSQPRHIQTIPDICCPEWQQNKESNENLTLKYEGNLKADMLENFNFDIWEICGQFSATIDSEKYHLWN